MSNTRRSSRLALSIPVEVSGADEAGAEFQEKATTQILSRNGAYLFLQKRLAVGTEIDLRIPHLERQQRCRVVWVKPGYGGKGLCETGIELKSAEDFWGVQFPPEDWKTPKQAPLAGIQPGRSLPHFILGDNEQQMVTIKAMLSALITVLEEKGVVSPAELAEMLRRID